MPLAVRMSWPKAEHIQNAPHHDPDRTAIQRQVTDVRSTVSSEVEDTSGCKGGNVYVTLTLTLGPLFDHKEYKHEPSRPHVIELEFTSQSIADMRKIMAAAESLIDPNLKGEDE